MKDTDPKVKGPIIRAMRYLHRHHSDKGVAFMDSILTMHCKRPDLYPTAKQWAWVKHYCRLDADEESERIFGGNARPHLRLVTEERDLIE